ncbi:MAG: NusG domain II-containing protein [Bacilli bacterium]|nr:NusG domain II-containing protein [Bacilli bacterium]
MDRKKLRNDLFLILGLLLVASISLIVVLSLKKVESNAVAKVYVQNEVVEVIDLSKKEDKDYYIDGLKGKVHIHTHDGAIAVVESNCPHQDCVHMGYVSETNHPIICAYNAVYIVIEGSGNGDVVIG